MAFLIPDNASSRDDIPNAHRRVANAFRLGLEESVTCWYEPLFDEKSERPHFVVLLPQRGILVLEVFAVKAAGLLGGARGKIRVVRDGKELNEVNPLLRAERLAASLTERIGASGKFQDLDIPVQAIAIFPYVDIESAQSKSLFKVVAEDRTVLREAVDTAHDDANGVPLEKSFIRALGGTAKLALTEEQSNALRGILHPDTLIDSKGASESAQLAIFRAPENDVVRVMDRQQESLAKSMGGGHRVIRGVAGSGKTLVLVCRARLLARLAPHHRILVTCYTRSLAGQLRSLLSEYPNIEVMHLDKLMALAIRSAAMQHPGYEGDSDGENVAQVALEAVLRSGAPRYRAVLVDEAQDFGTTALKFALALLEPGRDDLVIVADAAQRIFGRNGSWKSAGIQAQGRTRIMRVNYRNTKEILEFASRFLLPNGIDEDETAVDDELAIIPAEACERRGTAPTFEIVDDVNDECAAAVTQVRRWAKQAEGRTAIGVLYAASKAGRQDRGQLLHRELSSAGVDVFWVVDPARKENRDRLAESAAPVILSTIHSAKGLEFQSVVLCGLTRGEDEDTDRKLAYVGMTRATDVLHVIEQDGSPLVQDLERAAGSE